MFLSLKKTASRKTAGVGGWIEKFQKTCLNGLVTQKAKNIGRNNFRIRCNVVRWTELLLRFSVYWFQHFINPHYLSIPN